MIAGETGSHLLGTQAPEWQVSDWINSAPLALADLRGRVVLVRWWTANGCPYCRATAPALNGFHARFGSRGLTVIGLYHHKSDTPLQVERVKEQAREFGFEFPVAIDRDWKTLHRWWLDREESGWTSVSFLIDRRGIIRYIHPGGQYVDGDKDYAALEAKIEQLIAEN